MANIISLTGPEIRVNAAYTLLPYTAIDVADYDRLNFSIYATYVDTTNAPSCVVQLWTGMQTDTTDGWVQLPVSATLSTPNTSFQTVLGPGGFLRYISWSVPTFTNSGYIGINIRASCFKRALVALP